MEELPLLPLDLWRLIWSQMDIFQRSRCELACRSFAKEFWGMQSPFVVRAKFKQYPAIASALQAKPRLLACCDKLELYVKTSLFDTYSSVAASLGLASRLTQLAIYDAPDSAPLLAAVKAGAPLATVNLVAKNNKIFDQVNASLLTALKPTLTTLVLIGERTPRALLDDIVLCLADTLRILAIATPDWSMLKPMKVLKFLHIVECTYPAQYLSTENIEQTVALHRKCSPESIGINVSLSNSYEVSRSLLRAAVSANRADLVTELITKHGANPNQPIWNSRQMTQVSSIISNAIDLGSLAAANALLDCGADFRTERETGSPTIFLSALFPWEVSPENWQSFVTHLFDVRWPLLREQFTTHELLPHPKHPWAIELIKRVASNTMRLRFATILTEEYEKFIQARPQIFGDVSAHACDTSGCNMFHHCELGDDVSEVDKLGVDWRVRDSNGRNAIECLAWRSREVPTLTAMLSVLSNEDFVQNCTPLVVGMINSFNFDLLEAFFRKFIELVPMDRWRDLITHHVNVQVRQANSSALLFLFHHDAFRDMAYKAIFGPFDVALWSSLYNPDRRKAKRWLLPVPHLLARAGNTELLTLVIKRAQAEHGVDWTKDWFNQVDRKDRTGLTYVTTKLTYSSRACRSLIVAVSQGNKVV